VRKIRKNSFTLVEILVAMAVFSILLTLMVQFFASARTLWTANEKRASVYADASVAMDLMSMLLQTTFFTDDPLVADRNGTPFQITAPGSRTPTGWNSMITFVSNSTMELTKGGSVRYLQFRRGGSDSNILQLRIFSDADVSEGNAPTDPHFDQCFLPFGPKVDSSRSGALSHITSQLRDFADAAHVKPILRNVTGLKFTPLDHVGNVLTTPTVTLPAGVEIELSLMADEATVVAWAGMAGTPKDDFRTKNEYTFRRTVWLGDRTYNQ